MAIPHLVAHRGQMEHYPENTLISLEAALQCGATYIEFDVQCTADGKLVVIHDIELERTTGVKGNVFEMSYDELKNIRAHEPERFSLAFFNQHIPSLSDVIRLLQNYPKANAFVEIKEETLDQFGIENIMPALLKELDIVHNQCTIISFDYAAICYVKNNSDYLTGWVLHKYDNDSHKKADELKPDYLIVNHRKLPENEEPWQSSWHWMVYDITDPELAMHYSSFNIPLIETRNICNMLEHPILILNSCDH
jgi:glycerophosphoryl diester phosphodiesterase